MSERKTLILDLDTGIDDALALAYTLGSPEVELVGIIASYGNVTMRRAERSKRLHVLRRTAACAAVRVPPP